MSELDNKALVRRYYDEVLNQGQLSVLDQIAAHDYMEHDPLPGQGNGRDDLRARVEMLRAAFKPQFSIEDIVANSQLEERHVQGVERRLDVTADPPDGAGSSSRSD